MVSESVPSIQAEEHESSALCAVCSGQVVNLFPFGRRPRVVRCLACHTESIRPLPTLFELERRYSNYPVTKASEDRILFLSSLSVKGLRWYAKRMGLTDDSFAGCKILEIGFGNGAGLLAAAKLGFQTFGIDLDPVSVSNATLLAQKHSLRLTCLKGDVSALAGLNMKFDIIKASQILEHIRDPIEFLSEIGRSQDVGGFLIIECPNNDAAFWWLKNSTRRMFNRLNYYNSLKLHEHLWGYNKNSLPKLLKRVGYRTVMVQDYSAGNAIFEPESVLWYPTLLNGLRYSMAGRTWGPLMYSSVRIFDLLASALWHKGTGLAVLCQKQEAC
jgi:2-polyprenyl-3-methyl-5-hydroxy-6-metoxy-1,4-benzoquinol methylase